MKINIIKDEILEGYNCSCGLPVWIYIYTQDNGKHYSVELHCQNCSSRQKPIIGGMIRSEKFIPWKQQELVAKMIIKEKIVESR